MPAPSIETLQRIASETSYQPDTIEKVLRLLDILQEISRDAELRGQFALKGGTALNVFHLDLDRLSVDIDLNYIGARDLETMKAERNKVEDALNRLLEFQGYTVRRQPGDHAGGKWIMRFASALGQNATLEVDLNYMARQPLFGTRRMSSVTFGGMRANDVLVLDIHEIVAGKLVALFDRHAARDLFDARRILEIPELDWKKIKAAFLAFGACTRRDWRNITMDTITGDPQEIRQKLAICLPRDYFGGKGAIDEWMTETIALCQEQLAFLLDLTQAEREFLDGILERGEINAGLLDVSQEICAKIAAMPMLAWKCQHIRQHKGLES